MTKKRRAVSDLLRSFHLSIFYDAEDRNKTHIVRNGESFCGKDGFYRVGIIHKNTIFKRLKNCCIKCLIKFAEILMKEVRNKKEVVY